MTRRRWPASGSCCAPAARLGEAVAQALAELEQGRGAVAALRAAHRLIERNVDKAVGRLDSALAALERALSEATEAQAQLEAARDALEFDPARLEKIEERLFALRAAARKHGVAVPELAALADKFAAQLAALDDGAAGLKRLAGEAKAARAAYVAAAEAQAAARRKGAARLDKAVAAELGAAQAREGQVRHRPRRLARGRMVRGAAPTACSSRSPPIPARRPRRSRASPRAASSSRFLLALKVCLAKMGDAGTIVFDEVDSGIGGATAAAVGERLKRLAKDVQVLVVTAFAAGRGAWPTGTG